MGVLTVEVSLSRRPDFVKVLEYPNAIKILKKLSKIVVTKHFANKNIKTCNSFEYAMVEKEKR